MSYQEPARKVSGPPSSLPSIPSDDSTTSLELLYMLDTSFDRELEIDLATIPTGPSDGPAWAQHNFSYLDLPIELTPSSKGCIPASETKDIADKVFSVLDNLLDKNASLTGTARTEQPEVFDKDDADQCSSTGSEIAKLY